MPTYTIKKGYNKGNWEVKEEDIIEFIKKEDVVKGRDIAREFGVSYNTARKYLDILTSEGLLKKNELKSWKGSRKFYVYRLNE